MGSNIPLTQENIEVLKQSHVAFCDAIKGKFGCTAVIHNVDLPAASSFGSAKRTITPEIKYSKQLSNGLNISVWKDDLTTHKVDAVVNAANENLNHAGGLALALSNAAGPEFQRSSDEIIKDNGKVNTGTAIAGRAGNLPCKYVFHAVGPQLFQNPSKRTVENAKPLLEKTIWCIFQLTEFYNLQSVAIPALSSGIFNFPRDLCARTIVTCVNAFSAKRQVQHRLDIRLVNNDDPTVQEMLTACRTILGPPDSQNGAVPTQSNIPTKSIKTALELGGVTLFLKKGSIEEETTDVIVNTISNDLKLSLGYVSKAILEKAGPRIQAEIKKPGRMFAYDGDVIETSAHQLNCKAVFHTVCPTKSSDHQGSANQTLQQVISRCLGMAKDRGFSSISFPAIGTGNLGFKNEEVAQIMITAVEDFARTYKGMNMGVFFVIFPRDNDKFKAFENEMRKMKQLSSTKDFSSTTGKNFVSMNSEKSSGTPRIEFIAESSEAQREAKAWAMRMLFIPDGVLTINNNHVVQFDQKDHERLMSLQTKFGVIITEFFREGKCGIAITGQTTGLICAALEVEAMLCQAQENFALDEEKDLQLSVGIFRGYSKLPKLASRSHERTLIDTKSYGQIERERKKVFEKCGLQIVKVEKIKNDRLEQVFELNKRRVSGMQKLYQCVPAQFCDLICRVGFQRVYATPEEQKHGAGIYFTKHAEKAKRLWKYDREEYIYIFEAQVLTGKAIIGTPELIVPPILGTDPLSHYDSVTNVDKDIHVIFHGHQALPEYLITCIINKSFV